MSKNEMEEKTPVLEIKPSEEFHPRPLWQRIGAWVLIVMVVLATVACAFWSYL